MSAVPPRVLDAVRELLTQHARELGLDPATVRRLASPTVTARSQDGGLLRLDVSAYGPTELAR